MLRKSLVQASGNLKWITVRGRLRLWGLWFHSVVSSILQRKRHTKVPLRTDSLLNATHIQSGAWKRARTGYNLRPGLWKPYWGWLESNLQFSLIYLASRPVWTRVKLVWNHWRGKLRSPTIGPSQKEPTVKQFRCSSLYKVWRKLCQLPSFWTGKTVFRWNHAQELLFLNSFERWLLAILAYLKPSTAVPHCVAIFATETSGWFTFPHGCIYSLEKIHCIKTFDPAFPNASLLN